MDEYQGAESGRGRSAPPKRNCAFCVDGTKEIDYKKHDMLSRYVSEYGRIKPRRQTGVCAKHQRGLATAVKRARHLALLPFVAE